MKVTKEMKIFQIMKSTPKMNVISKMKMTPKIKTTLMKIIFLREREIERERERGLLR